MFSEMLLVRPGGSNGSSRPVTVSHGSGLVLTSSAAALTSSDDPMVQQIRNLREFIREAARLGRRDEVKALEENLAQLQDEYAKTQKERRELEDNYDSFKGIFHKHSPAKNNNGGGGAQQQRGVQRGAAGVRGH